jgi:signal transduction histidine kinase
VLLLLLVFFFEVGVVLFVIQDVFIGDEQIKHMYDESVVGLRRIGDMQYEAQETRRITLYALSTNNVNLQVNYAEQSRAADARVSEAIADNIAQAREPLELEMGRRLERDWLAYLKVRDEVIARILEGNTKEAVELDLATGLQSFDLVRADLEEIKRFYDEHASGQLRIAMDSDRRTVIKLMGVLAVAFLLGSIAIWAIQRNRMRSEVQLAKLQMDFVASVSHELRTPIAAILSAGENVRDGLAEGEELLGQGSIVVEQANQLMALVDQVLLFAATSGGIEYHRPRALQVSEIFETVLRTMDKLLKEAGFTVRTEIAQETPNVFGDLASLSQCLQNLIENAVKYSATEHWIGLSAKWEKQQHEVCISVADHGIGIDTSELPHIFEPFYRSPQAVAAQIHGTGLGLSIAKRNAESYGGRLSVVSQIGTGSVFTLHIPVAENSTGLPVAKSKTALGVSK